MVGEQTGAKGKARERVIKWWLCKWIFLKGLLKWTEGKGIPGFHSGLQSFISSAVASMY
jgi:hypothetical protein